MRWQIKAKRWFNKNILHTKSVKAKPAKSKPEPKPKTKSKDKVPKVDYPVRRTQPEPVYHYQPEPVSHSRKGSNMKPLAVIVIVVVIAIGVAIWWLQKYVSDTAAVVALTIIGLFFMYLGKDLMDNLKLKQHNESQRITAEMLTEFNRNDAMTDNYRQRTTLENSRFNREQLKIERQREVEQLRLQQQQNSNQRWADQDEYDYENVKYEIHE